MEKNEEIYDIIMTELNVFLKEGETIYKGLKTDLADALVGILKLMRYKRQEQVEKDTAKVIFKSLYDTAILCHDNKLTLGADDIKSMAKTVYDVDIVEFPYMERVHESFGDFWEVNYINNGTQQRCLFESIYMADEFIKTLKEKENG